MPFFNFNLITDPPDDEFVNEETQLNDNWDQLESGLSWLQFIGSAPPLELGIDTITSGNRHSVWNGTSQRIPYQISGGWTAWTAMVPTSPYVVRPGFPFKWRRNGGLRKVQVTGGLLNTASALPWSHTSWLLIQSTSIPLSFAPADGMHIQHGVTAAITGSTVDVDVAGARLRARTFSGNVWLEVHYMGQDGGGNFVQLDGLEWYY